MHADILPPPESREGAKFRLSPFTRVHIGEKELAICGEVILAPAHSGEEDQGVTLVVLDVGFKQNSDGKYGPYDIDGSGQKRLFTKPYLLVRRVSDTDQVRTVIFEFDREEEVLIGRNSEFDTLTALELADEKYVSRKHAKIKISNEGTVTVTDMKSSNGTDSKSATELLPGNFAEYGYTARAEDYVSMAGKSSYLKNDDETRGWGYGEYSGRPIIARDTPINGGVYLVGSAHGEALVVDDKKYPEELNDVYNEVLSAISEHQGSTPRNIIVRGIKKHLNKRLEKESSPHELEEVYNVVSRRLRYDLKATNEMARDYQKISLNSYISYGIGVCRTQALLCGYLLERLIKEGKLRGSFSIDRNMRHDIGEQGGHAWARFRDEHGNVYIIDPAQEFVGPLSFANKKSHWDYRRTEDLLTEIL